MRIPSLLTLLFVLHPLARAAVLAIDYGAEFTKLSLVKPGAPLDVVLDRDSKRKIQSVVGWKREDRVFGQEGKMAATRFPETHFPYIKPLLGSDTLPALPIYPNPPTIGADGALIFPHRTLPSHLAPAPPPSKEVWTPTALLAHQLSYYRGLAESLSPASAPEPIKDVIVTVPAWWNQFQRRAYRDALELQGLSCLAMVGEGTGVALNYAMTRTFPTFDPATGEGEKEYHLIYDSGALSTTATVVAFWQTSVLPTPKSKTSINTTHIEVLGAGWENVGGVMLDLNIQEVLVEDFIQKSGKQGVREDKRAMAKLAREANRVKQILSANQETSVGVESLHDDVDYRSRLSREILETAIQPSFPLFSSPINSALQSANLSLPQLTSVILFGGNTRVPFIQSAIRSVLGDAEARIAQNVNTDEAAVLGAAYYGASLSRQFKIKNLEVTEPALEEFTMGDEVLFEKGAKLGTRKTISIPAEDDSVLEFSQGAKPILSVQLVDVATALSNYSATSPIVNLTMRLDARGHLATANAVLVSNVTEAKEGGVAGALKGLFGGKKDKADAEEYGAEEVEIKGEKVALRFREKHLGIKPLTGEEKRTTMARLTSIGAFEAAKAAREEARNGLEGHLYRLSGLLNPGTDSRALQDYSTEMERAAMSSLLKETFEWLSDHAERADEKSLRIKRSDLEKLESPIILRFTEKQSRPKAVEDFQQAMFSARAFFIEAQKNHTAAIEAAESVTPEKPVAPPKYTAEELKTVETLLKENEVWMDEKMTEQVKLEEDRTKDPVILTKDLNAKGKNLQMTVLRLLNKKAPRAPRPASKSTSSTASTSASASVEQETASSAIPEEPIPSSEPSYSSEPESTSDPDPSESAVPPPHEEL